MNKEIRKSACVGKVWLVGAGPGDAGLLTLKGKAVLEAADVVVYDHLVGRGVLEKFDTDKRFLDVGKTAGHHPIPQDRINEILVEEARKGRRVVRLKGGDPFLFGRGGEELEALARNGIPFEVVPGVTSPLAVPAYNGIPVTHRDYASALHIVTGHAGSGRESSIHYKALVEAGGTIVFLMGVAMLERIVEGLLEAGMDPEMPAAVLQEGTTAAQRRVTATVSTLSEEAKRAHIKPPALIIVGRVCELGGRLSWYEKLPLMGRKILLTRPKELISDTAQRFRELGAEVLELPVIDTVPIEDSRLLRETISDAGSFDWIVFTSQVGVRIFFEKMAKQKVDIRCLHDAKFAVIGEGTKKALERRGIYADVIPEVYDGESLGIALSREDICGKKILIPRAEAANQELVPILEDAGALVTDLPIYRTVYRKTAGLSVKEEVENGRISYVVFTSSSTVKGFAAVSEGADYSRITAVCIGQQTAKTAEEYGMKCVVSKKATIDSVVELVEKMSEGAGGKSSSA